MSASGASRRRVIVFARAPQLGCVKTRLAADVGAEAALALYRDLGERTVAAARAVRACELEVCYTPADRAEAIGRWLGADLLLSPQADGDLGDRMYAAISEALADGVAAAVVVGTDCPTLDAEVIEHAFAALETADVVLGPALDGGYYLIAVRATHPVLFEDIPWSSPETFARTIAVATEAGLRVTLLDERADIDTAEDLHRWLAGAAEAAALRH